MPREERQSNADSGSLPAMQPSRGDKIMKERDTAVGTKLSPPIMMSKDSDKNSKDNSSPLREEKLRRLEQSAARKKAKRDTKTDDHSAPSKQKLRLAPGVAPESSSPGAMRVGGDEEVADGLDIENNLLEAEVAPNTDELVEQEVERRMQEQRHKAVVAQAMTEEQHPTENSADDAAESQRSKTKRKQSFIVCIAIVLIAAIGVGVWASQSRSADELVPTVVSLRDEVEFILADYAPLDEPTMVWLTELSSWKPDDGDSNSDYLWLERYALAFLYRSTTGPLWTNSSDWLSDKPVCDWSFQASPRCGGGPITTLNLDSNGLVGSLPPIIFQLTALSELYLGDNRLTSSIPSAIGELTNLVYLCVGNNQFKGSIPSEIGKLSLLGDLWIYDNPNLSGSIPSEIGELTAVTKLYLYDNNLSGSIPSEIGKLSLLQDLWLYENPNLSGSIPSEIGELTNVTELYLYENNLRGPIPSTIGNLQKLITLDFNENGLTGSIPPSIGNLVELQYLTFFNNSLSSTIPPSFASLTKLEKLWFSSNKLVGTIPEFIGKNLTLLKDVAFDNNLFEGSFPESIISLGRLEELWMGGNEGMVGSLPSFIGDLTKLTKLMMQNMGLTGSIPSEIGKLRLLRYLWLYENPNLSGSIPSSIANLIKLEKLYLYDNNLSGSVPVLPTNHLETCWLYGNCFSDFGNGEAASCNVTLNCVP